MTAVQAKMQPELEKINKKYANDPKLLKQKQNELFIEEFISSRKFKIE